MTHRADFSDRLNFRNRENSGRGDDTAKMAIMTHCGPVEGSAPTSGGDWHPLTGLHEMAYAAILS
jgi:hypothetical protein